MFMTVWLFSVYYLILEIDQYDEKAYRELEAEVQSRAQKTRGSLPKDFESKSEPEPPKSSRGTLPKGF